MHIFFQTSFFHILFIFPLNIFSTTPNSNESYVVERPAIGIEVKYQTLPYSSLKHGDYIYKYNNRLLIEGEYKKNLRDGEWRFYSTDDILQVKGQYVNNEKNGIWEYFYKDGNLAHRIKFNKNLRVDSAFSYYQSGQIASRKFFIGDSAVGTIMNYHENGNISQTITLHSDRTFSKKFYPNGNLKEIKTIKNGVRDSIYLFYYENEILWEKIDYKNGGVWNVLNYNKPDGSALDCCTIKDGNGIMRFYDKVGRITEEEGFINGLNDGIAKYYDDGMLYKEGEYQNNEKIGVWKSYNDQGKLLSEVTYSNSKKNGLATYYYDNGKIQSTGIFKDGNRDSIWVSYSDLGKIISEINYIEGKYSGLAKFHNKTGKITSSGNYINGHKVGKWIFYNKKQKPFSEIDYGLQISREETVGYTLLDYSSSDKKKVQNDTEQVIFMADEMPSFPGGETMLFKFLGENIKYPKKAINNYIQGIVYINFIVNTEGEIEGINLLRGVHYLLDEEALRVVSLMPPWIFGKQLGESVKVSYNLPIRFTLK